MNPSGLQLVKESSTKRLEDLPDDDLMLLVKAERQDAFEALAKRYQKLVWGLSTRFLGDRMLGRDAAQDVFLSLWAERERYQPLGRFRSYLVSVTLNRCHVMTRQSRNYGRKLSKLTFSHAEPEQDLPVDKLVEAERARQVRKMLIRLPKKTRQVLILRYTHDLTLDEIAESTGLPLGTVKSHVFRGLRCLCRLLGNKV